MRVKQARHHLAVASDRGDSHDVHAPLEERRREVVPAQEEIFNYGLPPVLIFNKKVRHILVLMLVMLRPLAGIGISGSR